MFLRPTKSSLVFSREEIMEQIFEIKALLRRERNPSFRVIYSKQMAKLELELIKLDQRIAIMV